MSHYGDKAYLPDRCAISARFTLLDPELDQLANDSKNPQGRINLRQALVTEEARREGLGGLWKKGVMNPRPSALKCLSPHSVCKKSPNLLAALLPLPDLSLKQ